MQAEANVEMAHFIWRGELESGWKRQFRGWSQWSVVNPNVEDWKAFRRINLDNPLAYIRDPDMRRRAEAALNDYYPPEGG